MLLSTALRSALSVTDALLHALHDMGTLPSTLGKLTNLTNFDVGANLFMSGTLPSTFASFPLLESLTFPYTRISGTVPNATDSLPALQRLTSTQALLSGTLPASFAQRYAARLALICRRALPSTTRALVQSNASTPAFRR